MKLNIKNVLQKEVERLAKPTPMPVIKVNGEPRQPVASQSESIPIISETKAPVTETMSEHLKELHAEMAGLKRQRGKLSSSTVYVVQDVEKKLRADSPAIANEFLKGNVPMAELAEHYKKIDSLTEQTTRIWDKIRHIEEHGTSAIEGVPGTSHIEDEASDEIKALKYEIRRLDDLIHKTQKKLKSITGGLKPKKNAGKWIADYKDKIALADAQREVVKARLKTLKYE